jgi:hypothetical protein
MALLNSTNFDPQRGYPNGSALAEPFKIKTTAGVPNTIAAGKIVTQELQNGETVVDLASTPDLSSADPIDAWLVVEGNDDYSGEYVGKCMAVKCMSGVIWATSDFATGTYTPGTPVSFSSGQIKVKAANEQIIGHVLDDNSATTGVIRISS